MIKFYIYIFLYNILNVKFVYNSSSGQEKSYLIDNDYKSLLSRKQRYVVFEKGSAVTVTAAYTKLIISSYPRGLNIIGEESFTYDLPSSINELRHTKSNSRLTKKKSSTYKNNNNEKNIMMNLIEVKKSLPITSSATAAVEKVKEKFLKQDEKCFQALPSSIRFSSTSLHYNNNGFYYQFDDKYDNNDDNKKRNWYQHNVKRIYNISKNNNSLKKRRNHVSLGCDPIDTNYIFTIPSSDENSYSRRRFKSNGHHDNKQKDNNQKKMWPLKENIPRKSMMKILNRIERQSIFDHLEKIIEMQGLDGKSCILQTICEVANFLLPKGQSLFHDIMRILFHIPSLVNSGGLNDYEFNNENYIKAAISSPDECLNIYGINCKFSLLRYITEKIYF